MLGLNHCQKESGLCSALHDLLSLHKINRFGGVGVTMCLPFAQVGTTRLEVVKLVGICLNAKFQTTRKAYSVVVFGSLAPKPIAKLFDAFLCRFFPPFLHN